MHSTQLLLVFAALLASAQATTSAAEMVDKRIVLEPGMHPIDAPAGTRILRREEFSQQKKDAISKRMILEPGMHPIEMPPGAVSAKRSSSPFNGGIFVPNFPQVDANEKRYVLEPGMHPVHTAPDTVALKRMTQSSEIGMEPVTPSNPHWLIARGEEEHVGKPLRLSVEPSKFAQRRSMPIEYDGELKPESLHPAMASSTTGTSTSQGKRYILDGPDGHLIRPQGAGGIEPMKRIVMEEPNGQIYHPSPVGPSKITPMKRADEMVVHLKQGGDRVILPREV